MPTPELMTWVPSRRRWTRMHKGKRFWVSCKALGVPETKEDSLHAANQWWRDKQAELDYAIKPGRVPAPMEDLAAASLGVAPDLFGNVRHLLEQALLREVAQQPKGQCDPRGDDEIPIDPPSPVEDAETIRRREIMGLLERLLFGELSSLPPAVAGHLPPARVQQVERAAKELRGETVAASGESGKTVKSLVEKWLKVKMDEVTTGQLSAVRLASIRVHIAHVANYLGEDADAAGIDEDKLSGIFNYCVSKLAERQQSPDSGWSKAYAKEVFLAARCWARWLVEEHVIDEPRNLNSRRFAFGSANENIETFEAEEVRRIVSEATAKLRLALLLQLNCGATQADVSDLLDSEVDWLAGRIVRKRSKTRKRANTPTVNYLLWPATFALLQEHRSGQQRVLVTKTGKPFVYKRLIEGNYRAVDSFGDLFRRLQKRLGLKKPMKLLRKTSATLLKSHPVHAQFVDLFLGHAPATMADKHYAAPPQVLFDEAVTWLGQQLGFVEAPTDKKPSPRRSRRDTH